MARALILPGSISIARWPAAGQNPLADEGNLFRQDLPALLVANKRDLDPDPEVRRRYAELSAEQGRLADLLLNLITPQAEPDGDLDGLLDAPPDSIEDVLEPVPKEESSP